VATWSATIMLSFLANVCVLKPPVERNRERHAGLEGEGRSTRLLPRDTADQASVTESPRRIAPPAITSA
jgi:hypothetical protein